MQCLRIQLPSVRVCVGGTDIDPVCHSFSFYDHDQVLHISQNTKLK